MKYPATKLKPVYVASIQPQIGVLWPGCPRGNGTGVTGYHRAVRNVGPPRPPDFEDAPPSVQRGWDGACSHCGEESIPWEATDSEGDHLTLSFALNERVWSTSSGKLEPGGVYWNKHHRSDDDENYPNGYCPGRWTNCPGRHLVVILPNGHTWDVDSRASNCTLPEDRTHRCWVRDSDNLETMTVGKGGNTCAAGAGSILAGDYHGFLQNGWLTASL